MLLSWGVLHLHSSLYLRIGTGTVGRQKCHMSYEDATPQLLSMWECTLCVYYICGSAHCMFNFITIIKPAILPSITIVREGLLFCEPNCLIWLGYKCNIYMHVRPNAVSVCVCSSSNMSRYKGFSETNGSSRRVCNGDENFPTT